MGATSPVDEVKAKLDIVEVLSESLALKRAGRTYKALCPFHDEKTPSFIVFPETGTWRCFGCNEGGDIFTFVMKRESLEFGEALRVLAQRSGVVLGRGPEQPSEAEISPLLRVNEAAALHYHDLLVSRMSPGFALKYLQSRGISTESVQRFLLGYAPDSGATLLQYLVAQGFDTETIARAGLALTDERGRWRDRFRGRIIFPIRDLDGRIVGFGGRGISSDMEPKYLNTAQTPVFDKGATLYALDLARGVIQRLGRAVVVEGYIDAIIAHQHGFGEVVASLGTAITDKQLRQLRRLTRAIYFALDSDAAGEGAARLGFVVAGEALDDVAPVPTRGGRILYQKTGASAIKIMALPPGKDADDVVRGDPSLWEKLLERAVPPMEYIIDVATRRHNLATPEGRKAALDFLLPALQAIAEPVQRGMYVQRVSRLIGVDEKVLVELAAPREAWRRSIGASKHVLPVTRDELENLCLALLFEIGEGPPSGVAPKETDFSRPELRSLFCTWERMNPGPDGRRDMSAFRASLDPSLHSALDSVGRLRLGKSADGSGLVTQLAWCILELKKRELGQRYHKVRALLSDENAVGPDQNEMSAWLRHLDAITRERERLENQQLAQGGAAPTGWRFRPAGSNQP